MNTRVQVTAPDAVVERWRECAAAVGVSLSSWVTMQVERPGTAEQMDRMTAVAEDMQRATSALLEALAPKGRNTKGAADV